MTLKFGPEMLAMKENGVKFLSISVCVHANTKLLCVISVRHLVQVGVSLICKQYTIILRTIFRSEYIHVYIC